MFDRSKGKNPANHARGDTVEIYSRNLQFFVIALPIFDAIETFVRMYN